MINGGIRAENHRVDRVDEPHHACLERVGGLGKGPDTKLSPPSSSAAMLSTVTHCYRYCYVRGPDGIIIGLVDELR